MSNENPEEGIIMTHPNPAVNPSLETDPLSPETMRQVREAIFAFYHRIEEVHRLELLVTALIAVLKDKGVPWGLLVDEPQSNLERDGKDLVRLLATWTEMLDRIAPRNNEGPVA